MFGQVGGGPGGGAEGNNDVAVEGGMQEGGQNAMALAKAVDEAVELERCVGKRKKREAWSMLSSRNVTANKRMHNQIEKKREGCQRFGQVG